MAAKYHLPGAALLWIPVTEEHSSSLFWTGRLLRRRPVSVPGVSSWRRKDGTLLDVEVGGSVILRDGRETLVAVAHDITERKQSEEALEESRRALSTLMSNLPGMAYRCRNDPDWTMMFVSEGCAGLTGYSPGDLIGNRRVSYGDLIHLEDQETVWGSVQAALRERRPFQFTYRITTASGAMRWVWEQGQGVFSSEGELVALEGFVTDTTERARTQRLLEERVSTLSGIAGNLTLNLPVASTLDVLAESVVGASTCVACAVALLDEKTSTLSMEGFYGLPAEYKAGMEASWQTGVDSPTMRAVQSREPVLIRGIRGYILDDDLYASVHDLVREAPWDVIYIVPLISRGRALGAINLGYLPDHEPGEDEKIFLRAVADQAAVAVENARLFSEAGGKAALEERQRLARELHDSVSQALHGIALGTETARELLNIQPEKAGEPLDYVLTLAEAGMAEMRALIFELRPESLETEGLMAALEKQAAALSARHGIQVEIVLCEEPDTSLEVKETVYRLAQEALHNTVKHASASNVTISAKCDGHGITLDISDDGIGFDPRGDFPGIWGCVRCASGRSALAGRWKWTAHRAEAPGFMPGYRSETHSPRASFALCAVRG